MKSIVNTKNAPDPVGPYNQAIMAGKMLFVSGQIAIDPVSGKIMNESIEMETGRVLQNLGAILKEAGLGYEQVVKTTVFVRDLRMYDRVNAVYARYFDEENAPARELVEVSRLPKDVSVEISLIAAKP